MGLYSRDYYRELSPAPGIFGGAPVVKYIIIINVVVFLLQIFVVSPPRMSAKELAAQRKDNQDHQDQPISEREILDQMRAAQPAPVVQEWLELDTNKVIGSGQVWRLLTHAFCHDRHNIFHILFNMLFLYWFGRTLELMYGSREFLLFYVTAAVCAALAFVGMDLYTGSPFPAVGASGAVMAVVMLYTVHFPGETICIFWFFQIQMRWLMALYVVWDLHPILLALAGDQMFTGIAHAAHLGGLAFGFLYGWYGWNLEGIVERLPFLGWRASPRPRVRRASASPACRPCEPDPEALRVDEVLEKISMYGQDCLTEEERTILRTASEKLKTRARGG
jgi:membrane associated rhomboid family serine protease